jgi:eukaryotic-like serine/threonine-protein kinase
MADDQDRHDPSLEGKLGEIAEEYTQRLENGERPDVEDYAQCHPELAPVIREVFPALEAMRPPTGIESKLSEAMDLPSGQALLPQHLGDYRILRELGRGGMGVVYEAEQQSLHRRVALKVLPFAAVLDPRQLQRFKNEAQAAANLHHSNIVPVFALNCERGVYYYAMQFINGHPLSLVIEELQRLKGQARSGPERGSVEIAPVAESLSSGRWTPLSDHNPASSNINREVTGSSVATQLAGPMAGKDSAGPSFFRTAAKLGIQVADAMQYAHDHAIVHRDIKPSNLLVDAEGHIWVADFGLALMQASPNITMPGDLLGTVRYMSPEQALANRVPIDHRTDIYSLGATLYELLALRPAFEGKDRQELLRQIAFDDPRPLRRVNESIPRELETIVGKCMAKRPDDRYPSAQELAADLRRFLADQPILAKPPTIRDRVSKWSRRHRAVVVSSCVSLILAVMGLSASTVLVLHQRNIARQQYDRAEANLRLARVNVDRMLKWMEGQEFSPVPYLARLRQDVLEQSLSFHRSLLPEKVQDPDARRDAGEVYLQLGRIKALLGKDAEAAQAYREGLKLIEDLVRDYPKVSVYTEKLANGCFDMAAAFWEANWFEQSEDPARRAIALFEKLTGDCPAVPYYPEQQRRSLELLGLILRDRGRLDDAQATLGQAAKLGAGLVKQSPNQPQHRVELARTYRNLADVQIKMDRSKEAAESARLAISMQAELAAAHPNDPSYVDEMSRTQRWWDTLIGSASASFASEPMSVSHHRWVRLISST